MPWLLEMTLVVSMLMAPPILYLLFRYYFISRKILENRAGFRFLLPAVLVSFYIFPLSGTIDFFITDGIDVLKYPKSIVYWFWFGLVFVFQLTTWVLIADMLKLVVRFFRKDISQFAHWHRNVVVTLFLLIFCYTGWKVYHDTTRIQVQEIQLSVDDLPKALEGFKLVHISDIQGDEYTGQEEIARYVQKVNQQDADLIVFTGDLISYGTDFIEMSARELGEADSEYGTIAVVGDHDYWAGVGNVKNALHKEGISLLRDENYIVNIDSTLKTLITGVTEVYSKASDPAVVDSLTNSGQDAALKIFASHQVKNHIIRSAQQNKYDVLLAGHTHGGQVQVPFMGMNFSASEQETEYISGLYREGALPINVNNGLGFTLAPIRYEAPPNISVITFVKK